MSVLRSSELAYTLPEQLIHYPKTNVPAKTTIGKPKEPCSSLNLECRFVDSDASMSGNVQVMIWDILERPYYKTKHPDGMSESTAPNATQGLGMKVLDLRWTGYYDKWWLTVKWSSCVPIRSESRCLALLLRYLPLISIIQDRRPAPKWTSSLCSRTSKEVVCLFIFLRRHPRIY